MSNELVYTSKCSFCNFWQEYQIYSDRLEFHTLFGKMTIPFDEIEKIEVSASEVSGLLHGDLHLKNFRPALKLDWANFLTHIVVDKKNGNVHRILFTPDNPEQFKALLQHATDKFKNSKNH